MARTVRIGSQLVSADPFWALVREAVVQKAEALGVDLVPLEIDFERMSGAEQVGPVEEILTQELDALLVGGLNKTLAYRILDLGLPIIFSHETDIRHPKAVSPTGLYRAAYMLGEIIAEGLQGRGRVLIAGGLLSGGDNGRSRIAGMNDCLQQYPDIIRLTIPGPWQYGEAYAHFQEVFQVLDGPVDALFGLSDSVALAARNAGKPLGLVNDSTLIVGVNGDPLALAAIRAGTMTATIETSADDFGGNMVELAIRAAKGEPIPQHFSFDPHLITRENVTETSVKKMVAMAALPDRLVGESRELQQRRLTQLETSLEINKRVGSILDRQKLQHELADIIRARYDYDWFQIFLWLPEAKSLELDRLGEEGQKHRVPLADSGLLGHTLLANKPTFIPDMHHSQRFPPDTYWPATRSRVILPIRQGNKIAGLLDLHSDRPTQHTHHDLIGLQALADQLGIAIGNAQLYREAVIASEQAEQANQLKSRLLANVSHELRTPLNVILGYSKSALSASQVYDEELPAAYQTDMRYIFRSAEHLMHLINDLLDVSRAEINELDIFPEPIDTRPFLEDTFQSYASSSNRRNQIEWRLELPRRLPLIQADPLRLRQILFNLLSNADKFTQSGFVLLGANVAEDQLHIWVQDTGTGMSEEQQQGVMEAFATAQLEPKAGQGMGLGLRITQELVTLHKGRIEIESEPDQGSTFHIFLPLPQPGTQSSDMPMYGSGYLPFSADEASSLPEGSFLPAHVNLLVRQATTYIHRRYGEDITRQEIAEHVGVSENYLTRVFRQELGEPLWGYLTKYRVTQAKQLLQHTSRSISDVAMMVGFNDAAYFSNVFKKQAGVSPLVYRKQKR